jgi:phosphate transport system ATP-binding protein
MTAPERPDVYDAPSESGSTATGAAAQAGGSGSAGPARRMDVVDLTAGFGERTIISGIHLGVEPNSVTALIGPSGCGKSTLLRCLNALHRTAPGAFASGEVLLDGVDINARGVDPVLVRRRVGMVFQRPNPFPTMSVFDNVAAGLRLTSGRGGHRRFEEVAERALRQADLWTEVKDRLRSPAGSLSGGQQQRLCIARALAVEPEVLLMDEPCSALDPISTAKIEETILALRERYTIVIVTHNMQQAARVSDRTAFMTILEAGRPGALVETGPTREIFDRPTNEVTGAYVSGRFG